MDKLRRTLISALAVSPLARVFPAHAQQGADPGYTALRADLPVENSAKVEVAEFFWYGCIHCYHFEPLLDAWVPKLPADVYFRRIPAMFNERWAHDAAIYYALEALGILDKLHGPLFEAIHKSRLQTDKPDALGEWLTRKGVEPKKLEAMMKSFGVQSKLKRAAQLTSASRIEGTPALMVHGRYTISAEQGRTREGMLAIAEKLIPVVRKTLTAAK